MSEVEIAPPTSRQLFDSANQGYIVLVETSEGKRFSEEPTKSCSPSCKLISRSPNDMWPGGFTSYHAGDLLAQTHKFCHSVGVSP